MPTYCSVKKSILIDAKNEIDKELIKDRHTYTFINDDTIRINGKQDDSKTKVISGKKQADEIAKKLKNIILKNYGSKVVIYKEKANDQDPYTLRLAVKQDYLEHEYNKLPKERQNETLSQEEINDLYSDKEYDKRADVGDYTGFLQKKELSSSKASPNTIKIIKDFAKRTGIDLEKVNDIVINGVKQDANAVALLTQRLVKYIDDKESTTLPEEVMHFAVAIIKQKNPELYNQLLKEINSYNTYKKVLELYSNDKNYQLPDGKPNIQKLKEEAIGKVLAETVIQNTEGRTEKPELLAKSESWWDKITNFLKGLFQKSGFDKAAMSIVKGDNIGEAKDINENENFLQLSENKQNDIYNKLTDVDKLLTKTDDGYSINGKKIKSRVTELVKKTYEFMFNDNQLEKSDYQKAVDELKAAKGTGGHADIEHLLKDVYLDKNGNLKDDDNIQYALKNDQYVSQLNANDEDAYNIIKENLLQRLQSFPEGTRFLSEIMVHSAKKDLAGTIDFIAIEKNGKINVLDWKFMNLNTEKYKDVPWYKVKAWNEQMNLYKSILKESYNISDKDFKQTMMVPIETIYSEGNKKQNILPQLTSIRIGDVNIKNIKDDYLIPVATQDQKTGIAKVDKILEKFNNEYKKLSESKVVNEEQRKRKNELLNSTFSAIRHLQMQQDIIPLVEQSKILNKNIQITLNEYNERYKNASPDDFDEAELNSFIKKISEYQKNIQIYTNLDIALKELFDGELSEEQKIEKQNLRDTVDDARHLLEDINNVQEDFVSNIIAKRKGVDNYMQSEATIKGMTRLFNSASTLQTNAIQLFYRLTNPALKKAAIDTLNEGEKLKSIQQSYTEWAKQKGLSVKNYFNLLLKKDKNQLIDEFKSQFYTELKSKIADRNIAWIKANVNVSEIEKLMQEKINQEYEYVNNKVRTGTDEEINNDIKKEKYLIDKQYDLSANGAGWLQYQIIKQSPNKDVWHSDEWKEINKPENAPVKELYNYIIEKNKEYQEIGYLPQGKARTFLPYVQKSMTEKLVFGGNISLGEQFLKSISVSEGDFGYGQTDPTTGQLINSIPKYFISELSKDISVDIFKNMGLYNEFALKFKYLSEIEDQAMALLDIEKNKQTIVTSYFGKAQLKNGEVQLRNDNTKNSELLENLIKATIFGQRYVNDENFDLMLGTIGKFGTIINKKLGIKLLPEDLEGRAVSLNKSIHTLNSFMRNKTMGLSLLSPLMHILGGHTQSLITSGKYFTPQEHLSAQAFFASNMLHLNNIEERKKFVAAINYFLPLTENSVRHYTNKLSISKLTQNSIQDLCMYTTTKAYQTVELTNFKAFLDNTILIDGKLVNTREYLKTTPKYSDMYEGTKEQRDQRKKDYEEDVKKLNKENNVFKYSSLSKEGHLQIEGIDQKSNDVIKLINRIQQFNKDAVGSMSEDDKRQLEMNSVLNSMMMFKHWIPRLMSVRFGGMLYNSASEAYEWGRVRTLFDSLQGNVFEKLSNLKNTYLANDKGIGFMKEQYEKKKNEYEQKTGKEFKMTSSDFIDMYKSNMRNNLKDAIFIISTLSLYLSLKANAPGKKEGNDVKNQYRFMLKAADKLRDELTFFYDPSTFSSLLGTSIFPSITVITDFEKAFSNFLKYNWGIISGHPDDVKNVHFVKYVMREIPFANQLQQYLPLLYPDLAKSLDIKIQPTAAWRQ